MALDELARQSTISLRSSSARSVFEDRFPKARRFTQAHAPRDHSLINAFTKMLPHVGDHLLTKVCPSVKHRHDNTGEFEPFVRA